MFILLFIKSTLPYLRFVSAECEVISSSSRTQLCAGAGSGYMVAEAHCPTTRPCKIAKTLSSQQQQLLLCLWPTDDYIRAGACPFFPSSAGISACPKRSSSGGDWTGEPDTINHLNKFVQHEVIWRFRPKDFLPLQSLFERTLITKLYRHSRKK